MANGADFETKWELLVADTWDDPELKQRLLNDPHTVLKERGIAIPQGLQIKVLEDTQTVEHLVLPGPYGVSEDEISERELESVAGGRCGRGGGGGRGCRGPSRATRATRGCESACRPCIATRATRGCRP
jgi:Nitrile hydratase, alpha chain